MNISVFGCGYVGLTAAVGLAELGHNVTGVEIDLEKLAALKQGKSPLFEVGLEEMMNKHMSSGALQFTDDGEMGIDHCDVVLCTVAARRDGTSDDLQAVLQVADLFARFAPNGCLLVVKSTLPVGSEEKIRKCVADVQEKIGRNVPFSVIMNPEFLQEGTALQNFLHPERVVVGFDAADIEDLSLHQKMKALYSYDQDVPFVFTASRNAEMIKLASNAFLATKISFVNQLADLCESTGADVQEVAYGMGLDSRIGQDFLQAGVGFGGSCLPKHLQTLMDLSSDANIQTPLFAAVQQVNERRCGLLVEKLVGVLGDLSNKKIGVWGITFKPETNDMREAPSLKVIEILLEKGADVCAFDPTVQTDDLAFERAEHLYEALDGVDALMVLTEWDAFSHPDFEKMKTLMKRPLIVDGRNMYVPSDLAKLGFEYVSVGRSAV